MLAADGGARNPGPSSAARATRGIPAACPGDGYVRCSRTDSQPTPFLGAADTPRLMEERNERRTVVLCSGEREAPPDKPGASHGRCSPAPRGPTGWPVAVLTKLVT
jgi:hypothetical protein